MPVDITHYGEIVGIAYRKFQTYVNTRLIKFNISFSEYMILIKVYEKEGLSQDDISTLLYIDKSMVARNLKLLEEKNFIQRISGVSNKRVKHVYPTDLGKSHKQELVDIFQEYMDQLFKDLPEEKKDFILEILEFMGKRMALV